MFMWQRRTMAFLSLSTIHLFYLLFSATPSLLSVCVSVSVLHMHVAKSRQFDDQCPNVQVNRCSSNYIRTVERRQWIKCTQWWMLLLCCSVSMPHSLSLFTVTIETRLNCLLFNDVKYDCLEYRLHSVVSDRQQWSESPDRESMTVKWTNWGYIDSEFQWFATKLGCTFCVRKISDKQMWSRVPSGRYFVAIRWSFHFSAHNTSQSY